MQNMAAFLSYIFLSAFTPGPNNIMAMTQAVKHGFGRGFRFSVGVFFGVLIVTALCAAFSASLFHYMPRIEPVMKWIGAGYILWLAWTIMRDKKSGKESSGPGENLVFSGMVLQLVNPKLILYGITAITTFILPQFKAPQELFFFVLVLSAVGFAGTATWALFGSAFQTLFTRYSKPLNAAMALLLVYCAATLVLG